MTLTLSDHQNTAFRKIINHDFSSSPFFLGGCAGTGKTTLLVAIAEHFGNSAIFLSPTGKACQVLTTKLPETSLVKTLHSALYSVREITEEELEELESASDRGDERATLKLKYLREQKDSLGIEFIESPDEELFGRIVVVDESSMMGYREYSNLLKIGAKVVFVGDPFQLQPVKSKQVLPSAPNEFHAFLSEVHRAALESPITRLATEIRSGTGFRGWDYWKGEGIGFSYGLDRSEYLKADQVITGMNTTRMQLNKYLRGEKSSHMPILQDKVIIKQNVYGKRKRLLYVNGDIGEVVSIGTKGRTIRFSDNKTSEPIFFNDKLFCETYDVAYNMVVKGGILADYAYAITAHASQGSEWSSVVIYDDEMRKEDKKNRLHWMYTAVTRSKDKLTIVKRRKK